MSKGISRRSILKLGTLSLSSGLATRIATAKHAEQTLTPLDNGIRKFTQLGRTNLMISDISFGASQLKSGQEVLVDHAFDKGINYFDTAAGYSGGQSEIVIGNSLKHKRDKVYLASKQFAGPRTRQTEMMKTLEGSLKRLQTDYIDVYFNHAMNDINRLKNPEWQAFCEKAKQQGKIRYNGISGHGGRLAQCVDYAIDNNLVDVLLLAFNFGQDPAFYERFTKSLDIVATQPKLPNLMAKAKQKQIGVIAMKVLRGARLNDMRPFEKGSQTYAQAALKWALANQHIDACIISMTTKYQINEYIEASGERRISSEELGLLQQYIKQTDHAYCRPGCGDCQNACPFGVAIADVLRSRMYAHDYENIGFAKDSYAAITENATACISCDGQPCKSACTYGLDIAQLCRPVHHLLG